MPEPNEAPIPNTAKAEVGASTLGQATQAFLARLDAPSTRRSYTQTLDRLTARLGADRRLTDVDATQLRDAVTQTFGHQAAATWNRHLGAVRSLVDWGHQHRLWAVDAAALGLDRRPEPADRTAVLDRHVLEDVFGNEDIPLVVRALLRLLYEANTSVQDALALDVDQLDLARRQATVRRPGDPPRVLHFEAGAAELLDQLVADRAAGPVFVTRRRARIPLPPADLDPDSGRARLSYKHAEHLCHKHTGWTLRQLAHSRRAHLGLGAGRRRRTSR